MIHAGLRYAFCPIPSSSERTAFIRVIRKISMYTTVNTMINILRFIEAHMLTCCRPTMEWNALVDFRCPSARAWPRVRLYQCLSAKFFNPNPRGLRSFWYLRIREIRRFYCKFAHKKFPNCISPSTGKLSNTKFYNSQTGCIFAKFITYIYRRANSKSLYSNCYSNSSDAFLC